MRKKHSKKRCGQGTFLSASMTILVFIPKTFLAVDNIWIIFDPHNMLKLSATRRFLQRITDGTSLDPNFELRSRLSCQQIIQDSG